MNVNDYFTNGYCEDCDCDPTQCYNQGYCQYDKDNGNLDEDETEKIEQLNSANYELENQVLDLKLELSDRDKLIPQGWECPKCGAVMSPTTSVCVNCNGQQRITVCTTNITYLKDEVE